MRFICVGVGVVVISQCIIYICNINIVKFTFVHM